MEDDWFRAFVHESGHAIMGAKQMIRCYGVFLIQQPLKACVLADPLPPPSELSNELRLYLAAGSEAELIIFKNADPAGSAQDRKFFGNPSITTFEEKRDEAEALLFDKKSLIEGLGSRLHEIYKQSGGDFSHLRVQRAGMGDNFTDYWVLLSEEELKSELLV